MYKTDQVIIDALFSDKTEKVLEAIETIKVKGNHLYLIPVFDLMKTCQVMEINLEIEKLLGTVKSEQSIPVFIDAISNEKYKQIRKKLLVACWQNGLDFKDYMPLFVDIMIEDDWENAFEAFTIIENLENMPSEEIVNESLSRITNAKRVTGRQNNYFLDETLKIIQKFEEGIA